MLSRIHWYFIFLFGFTCFGSSYFFFAAPSQEPVVSSGAVSASEATVPSGDKADCGDGVCVFPENVDRCPADCLL